MQFLLEGLLCFAMSLICFCSAAANSILFDGFCCKQVANSLCFFLFLLHIACKNEEIQAICKLFATKTIKKIQKVYIQNQLLQSKNIANTQQKHSNIFAQSTNLKHTIFAGRFAMFLLCHCSVFALQQLILYFLMVFVANSLQK